MILLAFPQARVALDFGRAISSAVGVGGWIIGVALVAVGVGLLASRSSERSEVQVLLALVVSAVSAIAMAATVRSGSGGAMGGAIGPHLASLIGVPATLVALAALGLAGLIVGLEISPSRLSALAFMRMGGAASQVFASTGSQQKAAHANGDIRDLASREHQRSGTAVIALPDTDGPKLEAEETAPEPFQRIFEGLDELEPDPLATEPAAQAVEIGGVPVASESPLLVEELVEPIDEL
jgi:hypothetical protein